MAFYAVCASVSSRPLCIAASVLAGVGLLALLIGRQAVTYPRATTIKKIPTLTTHSRLLGKPIG